MLNNSYINMEKESLSAYLASKQYDINQASFDKAMHTSLQSDYRRHIKVKVRRQGVYNYYTSQLHIDPNSSHADILRDMEATFQEDEWGKLSAQDTRALFVTLSPEPGTVDPYVFQADVNRTFMKERIGILSTLWCFEQSGTEENKNIGYHPHMHALLLLNKGNVSGERGKVKSFITRSFKKYRTKTDMYLDVKPVSINKLPDKIKYIKGDKRISDKQEKCKADNIWRKELGMDSAYLFPMVDSVTEDGIVTPLARFNEVTSREDYLN